MPNMSGESGEHTSLREENERLRKEKLVLNRACEVSNDSIAILKARLSKLEKALRLYEQIYGGRRKDYLADLREWKAAHETHAEGQLVERDLPEMDELDKLLAEALAL